MGTLPAYHAGYIGETELEPILLERGSLERRFYPVWRDH